MPLGRSSASSKRFPNLSPLSITFVCAFVMGIMNDAGFVACNAQTIIYREGFDDDGEGTRYSVVGRGSDPEGPDGPGAWDLSTLVDKIGLVDPAPAKRAAVLWTHDTEPNDPVDFWTDDALQVFSNTVSWAIDDKQNANIYFLSAEDSASDAFMISTLEGAGHVIQDLLPGDDIPGDADLVINSSAGVQPPGPFLADKAVPVVSYFGTNHDGLAVSKKGVVEAIDPAAISVVPNNADHPILGGRTGTITWTNDPSLPLQGIGDAPGGATVLATYVTSDEIERPAIVLIEEGGLLIGGFNPTPDGAGYWVGGDMNLDFGDGFAATPDDPRVLEIAPVDVAGVEDVQLTVALAATDADFEPVDFLRILIDPNNSGEFEVLADFRGVDEVGSPVEKALRDTIDGTTFLRSDVFTDVTYDIPSDATQLVVRFESYSTFPNEVVGIDNLRVTSGPLLAGDYNRDGVVDVADIDLQAAAMNDPNSDLSIFDENGDQLVNQADRLIWVRDHAGTWVGDADLNGEFNSGDFVAAFAAGLFETGQPATWETGDWNGDGDFDTGDFVAAFQDGGFEIGPRAAAVPEPSGIMILVVAALMSTYRASRTYRGILRA